MLSLLNRIFVFFLGFLPKFFVFKFARRYLAGKRLEDAVRVTQELARDGMMATLDVLGESITTLDEARIAVEEYKRCLRAIADNKLDANISLKPTQFGLGLDKMVAEANIREVVEEAGKLGIFVRLDMEDSPYTSDTIDIYLRLEKDHPHVGTVIQSYLRRSHKDVLKMLPHGINLRLVKGIYVEPRRIAYKSRYLVNRNFAVLLKEMFKNGAYVGVATHDEELVWEASRLVNQYQVDREAYEFQMLLGVDRELREIILEQGHRLRIYVPYGSHWYHYSMRRLKENPVVAWYIIKNMFKPE